MTEFDDSTKEIAKAVGKGIDAGTKFGQFIAPLIRGTLEQGIGIFEDKLSYMRWERQVRLMKRSQDFLKEIGLQEPNRVVPMKFAVPLLQAASLEDDDYLQDLFATLLVNAANGNSGVDLKRAYIDILEQITPLEARILEKIYSLPDEEIRHRGVLTKELPEKVFVAPEGESPKGDPTPEIELALSNLARLGCITSSNFWRGSELFNTVYPTYFGKKFVEACTLQRE